MPALDTVIRSDYLVNDDRVGGARHEIPQAMVNGSGYCLVTWQDFRNGDADALAQWFEPAGARIGQNFRACDDGDMWWQGSPAPAAQSAGNSIIAWEDRRGGKSSVTAQFYVDGIPTDSNFRISDSTNGDKREVALTILPDGRYVAAWEDWRRNNGAIYAQVLSPTAQPIGPNFWVNSSGTWQAYGVAIASDSSGNFALAWEDARSGWDVWCQRYDSNAQPKGGNFRVNSEVNRTYNLPTPALAMSARGDFIVVWRDSREDSTRPNIYAQRYSATGDTVGANFRVSDRLPGVSFGSPSVAHDPTGNFIVAWADDRNENADVYAQRLDPAGNRLGSNFRINNDPGAQDQGDPSVALSPFNEYWVFWTDKREGNANVYGQRLGLDGSAIGANFRANDDSFGSQQRVPTIAANDHGLNMTIWEDERSGDCDIYCQLADSLGNPIGPNLRANDDYVGADHFYSTAAIDFAGNSLTAWVDGRSSYNIYAQAFSPSGNRVDTNFRVNDDLSGSHWSPAAAKDSAGNSVVVFSDGRTDAFRIFGQRYNALNNPVGANFAIGDSGSGGQMYPSVAMSRNGRFVAAWMDGRDNGSIYCQVFDSLGPVGGNIKANDNIGSAYMGYPAVGCDRDGGFVVAWEDGRNPDWDVDIYAQRFDRDGGKLGANFRVNQDPPRNDQYSPSCGFDPQGRFVILWNDWRPPVWNPQIYVQRYFADGSPCGGNAVINEPDLFYYNHHWSMQHSVAASRNRLYFSWTDNRRHRGFDTYNKITDWNLVGIADPGVPNTAPVTRLTLSSWPNPAARFAQVKLRLGMREPIAVALSDVTGRRVRVIFSGTPPGTQMSFRLSTAGLNAGTYFLTARSAGQIAVNKIIVSEVK